MEQRVRRSVHHARASFAASAASRWSFDHGGPSPLPSAFAQASGSPERAARPTFSCFAAIRCTAMRRSAATVARTSRKSLRPPRCGVRRATRGSPRATAATERSRDDGALPDRVLRRHRIERGARTRERPGADPLWMVATGSFASTAAWCACTLPPCIGLPMSTWNRASTRSSSDSSTPRPIRCAPRVPAPCASRLRFPGLPRSVSSLDDATRPARRARMTADPPRRIGGRRRGRHHGRRDDRERHLPHAADHRAALAESRADPRCGSRARAFARRCAHLRRVSRRCTRARAGCTSSSTEGSVAPSRSSSAGRTC